MTHYTLGFLFNERKDAVLLVEKQKGPSCNIGKLNGIGGKFEDSDGTLEYCQNREFKEETGLLGVWEPVGHLTDRDIFVKIFKSQIAFSPNIPQRNDIEEPLFIVPIKDLPSLAKRNKLAMNVSSMIYHCLFGQGSVIYKVQS